MLIFAPLPALGAEGFGALISPGKLAKSHAKYDGIKNCTECHVLTGGVQDKKCLDCHDKLAKKIKEKKSAHAKYTKKCIACHRDHKGRNYQMINLDEEKFEHDDTGYELKFEHEQVKCAKCHKKADKNKYSGLKQECVECHDNAHKRQFKGRGCDECHTERGWEEETFKHDSPDYDGYKLTGKHLKVECAECHVRGRFKPIKSETCDTALCHKDEHKKQFKGQKCEECHTTKSWEEETFKHDSPSYKGYKLEGKHLDVKCAECHVKGKYKPIKTKTCDSAACHNSNEHKDQFKGQSCDECHTVKGWDVDAFDHDSKDYDGYKLEGKHRDVKCAECHIKGLYKPIKETCITCHKDDDDHKNELGKVCEKCHNVNDWKKIKLDHDTETDFPLIGKHNSVDCNECHTEKKGDRRIWKNGLFECEDCHDDYHEGKYEEKCKSCHTQYDWEPRNYKHYEKTGYKLEGAHNDTRCTNCHVSGGTQFKNVNRICGQCHLTPHFNQFGGDCSECHSSTNWSPTKFDHALTGFILTGNHRLAECRECHDSRSYRNTSVDCINCHRDIYNTAPKHVAESYPEDCRQCHLTRFVTWDFNHANAGADCASCHLGTPRNTVINHSDFGALEVQCGLCHSFGSNWAWTHPVLNSGVQCSACHIGYSDIPRSAKHDAAGWVDCEECHNTTTSWLPPSYNHSGVTNGCARCHLTYSGLTSPPRTTPHSTAKFGGLGDTQCELCHTRAAGPTWPFAHTTPTTTCMPCHLNYSTPARSTSPITHSAFTTLETSCEECHSGFTSWAGGTYNHAGGTGICYTCHLGYSNPARTTDHTAIQFGGFGNNDCELCHSTTSWLPFQHLPSISNCSNCHLNYSSPARSASAIDHTAFTTFESICEQCHSGFVSWLAGATYDHVGSTGICQTCHLNYSNPTRTTDHTAVQFGGFGNNDCELCHSTTAWLPFQHLPSISNCSNCHLNYSTPPRSASVVDHTVFTSQEAFCENCHSGFTTWAGGTYDHAGSTGICHSCHLSFSTPARTTPHNTAKFGGAGDNNCELCHTTTTAWLPFQHVTGISGCATCHLNDSTPAKPANHAASNWTVCEECHSPAGAGGSWLPASYNHTGVTTGCNSCHLAYSAPARTTAHNTALFGGIGDTTCETCHSTSGAWAFQHAPALTGCASCHLNNSTPAKPANHTASNWTVCEECHSPAGVGGSWLPASYTHTGVTTGCASCHLSYSTPARTTSHTPARFGGIGETTCEECHTTSGGWVFQHAPTLTGCATCHLSYSTPPRNTSVDHTNFTNETLCEECHSPAGVGGSWTPPSYDHTTVTTGCLPCHNVYTGGTTRNPTTHAGYGNNCEECHLNTGVDWVFNHVLAPGIVCNSCHLTYSTPAQPANHSANGWVDCEECHQSTSAWATSISYNHSGITTGCNSCHLNYTTPTRSTNHALARFGGTGDTTCEECHTTSGGWAFQHAPTLTGCATCHLSYSTPPRNTSVDHTNFTNETLCEECHSPAGVGGSWTPPNFDHTGVTSGCLPCHTAYTGANVKTPAHTTNGWINCEECHLNTGVNWVFNHNLAPGVVCNSCHLTVSTPAQPANHSANGWVDCEICHQSSTAWGSNINFNHSSTGAACSTCHLNYTSTPKSAQHNTNGWTACDECHSNTGSNWNYSHISTTFPLNHEGTNPNNCNECHPGGDYFNSGGCIECHTREGEKTHNRNRGNAGCLDCHPRGR